MTGDCCTVTVQLLSHTHNTQPIYGFMDFVQDNEWTGTWRNIHLLTPILVTFCHFNLFALSFNLLLKWKN